MVAILWYFFIFFMVVFILQNIDKYCFLLCFFLEIFLELYFMCFYEFSSFVVENMSFRDILETFGSNFMSVL